MGLRTVLAENPPKDHLPEPLSSHLGPLPWAVPLTCTQDTGKNYFSMQCMSVSALCGELKAFLHEAKGMLCPQLDYAKWNQAADPLPPVEKCFVKWPRHFHQWGVQLAALPWRWHAGQGWWLAASFAVRARETKLKCTNVLCSHLGSLPVGENSRY